MLKGISRMMTCWVQAVKRYIALRISSCMWQISLHPTGTPCRRYTTICLHGSHCMTVMTRGPHVTLAHCSVGCNQLAECLDWGAQGLIAYGAHHQAVVYDHEVRHYKPAVRDN